MASFVRGCKTVRPTEEHGNSVGHLNKETDQLNGKMFGGRCLQEEHYDRTRYK
ncbi:unnamed protein product [Sphenostylis stenocarpa]|uniref:Uncharacterized protein n=1 Tax=Sphenostylis stenocarpa TaxID=92480 RepID=A0AA86V6N5_9FABA|nr:unnamed protein product [Sphenostylis stenocarpa]